MERERKNILIAADGSEQAFEAVRYIGRLMPERQAKITLLHVMDLFPESLWELEDGLDLRRRLTGISSWEAEQRRRIGDFMQKAASLLGSIGYGESDISMVVKERERDVVRDIAAEAQKGYDALVVGRYGVSRVKDLVFGSIASKLLGHLRGLPLWIVGGSPDSSRVLVALDESEGAKRALSYVGEILPATHQEVLLLHVSRRIGVLQPEFQGLIVMEEGREWMERFTRDIEADEKRMEAYLAQCASELEKKGVDPSRIRTKVVREANSRSGAILDEARMEGCGTIVVGRRGLSKVEEFIMGRVSSKILQLAKDKAVWVIH